MYSSKKQAAKADAMQKARQRVLRQRELQSGRLVLPKKDIMLQRLFREHWSHGFANGTLFSMSKRTIQQSDAVPLKTYLDTPATKKRRTMEVGTDLPVLDVELDVNDGKRFSNCW